MARAEFEYKHLGLPESLWQAFALLLHRLVNHKYIDKLGLAIVLEGDIDRLIGTLKGLEEKGLKSTSERGRKVWKIEPLSPEGKRVRRAIILGKESFSLIRVVIPQQADRQAIMSGATHRFGTVATSFGLQGVNRETATEQPLREIPFARYRLKDDLASMEWARELVLEITDGGIKLKT